MGLSKPKYSALCPAVAVLGVLRGPDGVSWIGYRGVNGVWVGSIPRMLSTK